MLHGANVFRIAFQIAFHVSFRLFKLTAAFQNHRHASVELTNHGAFALSVALEVFQQDASSLEKKIRFRNGAVAKIVIAEENIGFRIGRVVLDAAFDKHTGGRSVILRIDLQSQFRKHQFSRREFRMRFSSFFEFFQGAFNVVVLKGFKTVLNFGDLLGAVRDLSRAGCLRSFWRRERAPV